MLLRGFNHSNNILKNEKDSTTTITTYYGDVACWSDMRLQKKRDTPTCWGELFETIAGYFPNPAIPWDTDSAGNNNVCDVTAAATNYYGNTFA